MADSRPQWTIKEISEADFRRIHSFGNIMSVEAKWEFTSADTTREWLEVKSKRGEKTETMVMPHCWNRAYEFKGHSSNPGLFSENYVGKQARENLNIIDKWESKNKRERADFERLKAKFGT